MPALELQDWLDKARGLSVAHEAVVGFSRDQALSVLVALHRLVENAYAGFDATFQIIPESELVKRSSIQANRITGGDFAWEAPTAADLQEGITNLCAQIRALDSLILRSADHNGPVSGPDDWLAPDASAYVIPRKRPAKPRKGHGYGKRGLLHHRIIAVKLGRFDVDLIPNDTITVKRNSPDAEIVFGAGVFQILNMTMEPVEGEKFVVGSVSFEGGESTILSQIEGALNDRCFGVVWPELCDAPRTRTQIQAAFSKRPATDARQAPQVIVAGSWHELDGAAGSYVNRAAVYDGYGNERLTYDKIVPYLDREAGFEAIKSGDKIPILVTDDLLIGFAICKDFCDLVAVTPFLQLNVDIILVPSMGDEKTMKGHQSTAKRIQAVFGGRTFVVQQAHPSGGELGVVLPMPVDPDALSYAEMRQNVPWKSYKVASK